MRQKINILYKITTKLSLIMVRITRKSFNLSHTIYKWVVNKIKVFGVNQFRLKKQVKILEK